MWRNNKIKECNKRSECDKIEEQRIHRKRNINEEQGEPS